MSRPTSSGQLGFTFIELVVTIAIASVLTIIVLALHRGADELSQGDRAQLRVVSDHRRNLTAVSQVLRAAAPDTLNGFDGMGLSTSPSFQRIVGAADGLPTLGDVETLEWRATALPVTGIAAPGAVYLVTPSGARLVAEQTPQDGFEVQRDGRFLQIRLTTYSPGPGGAHLQLSSSTGVMLRN